MIEAVGVVLWLTYQVGNEEEYVLIGLVGLPLLRLRRALGVAIHRSSVTLVHRHFDSISFSSVFVSSCTIDLNLTWCGEALPQ